MTAEPGTAARPYRGGVALSVVATLAAVFTWTLAAVAADLMRGRDGSVSGVLEQGVEALAAMASGVASLLLTLGAAVLAVGWARSTDRPVVPGVCLAHLALAWLAVAYVALFVR